MLASEETIEDHTAKFRDYLLFGHQKEGLFTVFFVHTKTSTVVSSLFTFLLQVWNMLWPMDSGVMLCFWHLKWTMNVHIRKVCLHFLLF